jgi:hypothetical protein
MAEALTAVVILVLVIRLAVGPTLPARRRRFKGAPLAHLANGPLVPVTPRVFLASHRSRFVTIATWVFLALTIVLVVLAGTTADGQTAGALAVASAIIAGTFAFSNWFAGRVRLRVDANGVHGRTLFTEHHIRWNEIALLSVRYVFLPGYSMRIVYYSVRSPTHEVSFTDRMPGSDELRQTIEEATGVVWAKPEIESNFG